MSTEPTDTEPTDTGPTGTGPTGTGPTGTGPTGTGPTDTEPTRGQHAPTVWPAFQAHDARAVIDFLVSLGFEETACYSSEPGRIDHAQLDWPEGGGVMLGSHKPDGPFIQQPGTTAAYIVTADLEAVTERARAAGIQVGVEVKERDYDGRELALRDPEGNQWTFGTYHGEPRRSEDNGSTSDHGH